MKAILVGAGGMGKAWGRNLRDNFAHEVELAAWVDLLPGVAEAAIAEVGIHAKPYHSVEEAIRESGAEILIDVTLPKAHAEVTIAGLEAGLDVIVEKPIAPTLAEANRMVETAERLGRTLLVSQSRRYDPSLYAFRDVIAERVPELAMLTCDFFLGPHFGGYRDQMALMLLLDMSIHHFDAARAITGRNAVSVYAEDWNPSWSWTHGSSGATCLFEMEGGVRFEYRGLWTAEGLPISWNGSWRAVGRGVSAAWDGEGRIYGESASGEGFLRPTETFEKHPEAGPSGIEGSLREFLAARREGRPGWTNGRENLDSLKMVLAAVESAGSGRRVRLGELRG